jgi:hypothetical protein
MLIAPSPTLGDITQLMSPVDPGGTPVAISVQSGKPVVTDKDQPAEPAAGGDKPTVAAPEIGAVAQNIDAGLKAIDIPPELWKSLPSPEKKELSRKFLEDLHEERSAYGRSARWTFASEAELLGLAPNADDRSGLAVDVLKVRAGIAPHQLAAAEQEVRLQEKSVDHADQGVAYAEQSVALAEQGVALREKQVEQQGVVTDILRELLAHSTRWRALSVWGVIFLAVALAYSMVLMVWLIGLTRDNKFEDWALPAAIFALALFVISPAVLLLRERPLKGLDEAGWPGTKSSTPQEEAPAAGGAAPAAPAPPATAPAAPATAPASTASATTNAAKSNHP